MGRLGLRGRYCTQDRRQYDLPRAVGGALSQARASCHPHNCGPLMIGRGPQPHGRHAITPITRPEPDMSAYRLRSGATRMLVLCALTSSGAVLADGLDTLHAHQSYARAASCLDRTAQGCIDPLRQYLDAAERTLQPGTPVQTGQELRLRLAQRKVHTAADRLRHRAAQQLDPVAQGEADQLLRMAARIDAILGRRPPAPEDLTLPRAPPDPVRVVAVLPVTTPNLSPSSAETPSADTVSAPSSPEETASLPLRPSALER